MTSTGNSNGALRVTAIDTANPESGAFSYPNTMTGDNLRMALDSLLNCLTVVRHVFEMRRQ